MDPETLTAMREIIGLVFDKVIALATLYVAYLTRHEVRKINGRGNGGKEC